MCTCIEGNWEIARKCFGMFCANPILWNCFENPQNGYFLETEQAMSLFPQSHSSLPILKFSQYWQILPDLLKENCFLLCMVLGLKHQRK